MNAAVRLWGAGGDLGLELRDRAGVESDHGPTAQCRLKEGSSSRRAELPEVSIPLGEEPSPGL